MIKQKSEFRIQNSGEVRKKYKRQDSGLRI